MIVKKYDFIIVYELKNREFDSACLLKYELERRGYSVYMVETWWTLHNHYTPVYADIMITFALYSDGQMNFTLQFARGVKKIINMCWEQIFTNAEECADDSLHHITGMARDMLHIAWGPHSVEWLCEMSNVPKYNIIPAGHIAMDFTKPRFKSYYKSREILLNEYGIDSSKKIALFISSFSYVGLSEIIMNSPGYESETFSATAFQKISVLSQNELMKWFVDAARSHAEYEFIYRPHPAEANNPRLLEIQKQLDNFKVIKELPVKQWILVADNVYSWFSTSVADAYFAKKNVATLRPVEIPYGMDIPVLNGCEFITTQRDFEKSLTDEVMPSEAFRKNMEYFYFYDEDRYSYEIICDCAEKCLIEVNSSDSCSELVSQNKIDPVMLDIFKKKVKQVLAEANRVKIIKDAAGKFNKKISDRLSFEAYTAERIRENCYNDTEMIQVLARIKEAIEKNSR